MADSEDSEVDVCTVDDEDTAKNVHSGLTLVAAELFLSDCAIKGEEGTVFFIYHCMVPRWASFHVVKYVCCYCCLSQLIHSWQRVPKSLFYEHSPYSDYHDDYLQ